MALARTRSKKGKTPRVADPLVSPLILGAFRARGPFALVDSLYMVELKVKLERELIFTSSSTHTPHAHRAPMGALRATRMSSLPAKP